MSLSAAPVQDRLAEAALVTGPEPGRIGPNAVIQLAAALRDGPGEETAAQVFAAAGLSAMLAVPPESMVSEAAVARLYRALFNCLPEQEASAAAREAGARTAAYVLANRIPLPVQAVLKRLPARLAAPLLLNAIKRNAWTFAGSATVRVRLTRPYTIEIEANPIAMPGCVWHAAVFEGLFRALVAPRVTVRHPACCHAGGGVCRFVVGVGDT